MRAVEARRIAAQWTGEYSYLPTWAPDRYVFARWEIVVDAGAGNKRLVLRFTRGKAGLKWQVSDSREIVRLRARVDCRDRTLVARVMNGRQVFFRTEHRVETAWICIRVGFPMTISVSQRAHPHGVSGAALQRMVAGARPIAPGRAPRSGFELPGSDVVDRIASTFARKLYLPSELPGAFIFSQWRVMARDYSGRRALHVAFGRDGLVANWSVSSGVDRYEFGCPARPSSRAPKPAAFIGGRAIFFAAGIHGASAWMCVPAGAVGNAKPLEVELWYDIRLDSTDMRRKAMHIVASARLVRPV